VSSAAFTVKVVEHFTGLDAAAGYSIGYPVGFGLDAGVGHALALLPETVRELRHQPRVVGRRC